MYIFNIFLVFFILGLGYVLEMYGWDRFMNFQLYGVGAMAIALIIPVLTLNSVPLIESKLKEE